MNDALENAPHINALLNGGKIMAFGNSKCVLEGQKGNTELGFYASFKIYENSSTDSGLDFSDRTQKLGWFKNEYAEWSALWRELLKIRRRRFFPVPFIVCL